MKIDRVFLDTSFFIRLFTPHDPDHESAKTYYRRFREEGATFILSTIVVAEYGVGDDIQNLPFRETKLVNFILSHARLAADLARLAHEQRRKGVVNLGNRVIIPNDTKLMAQAQLEGADLFIARDENCERVHHFLKKEGLITFDFLDLRTPSTQFFNELFP